MRVRIMRILRKAVLIAALSSMVGCGSSEPTQPGSQRAGWSTLGTRSEAAQKNAAIRSNAGAIWTDYDPPLLYAGVKAMPLQYITMRDGTRLAAYVTLPADAEGKPAATPLPVVLVQTSYNGVAGGVVTAIGGADPYIVQHGYATVVVDVRGTGQSEGEWQAFGEAEQADYAQVVEWVTKQPFSDGRIGVYGVSSDRADRRWLPGHCFHRRPG